MCGSSSTCCKDNNWWYNPGFVAYLIEERDVLHGFAMDTFRCQSVISVCEFNELYFDVESRM